MTGKLIGYRATNDSGWAAAFDCADAGAEVAAIIDLRTDLAGDLLAEAARRGIAIHSGSTVTGTAGRARIRAIEVGNLIERGGVTGSTRIACDLLAVAGGWAPNVALFSQSRGKLAYDETIAAFRPGQSWQAERSAGSANGAFATADCLKEGAKAGAEAARAAGFKVTTPRVPKLAGGDGGQGRIRIMPELPSNRPPEKLRAWIDLQDDVTSKDLRLAVSEGYRSVEHAKRYTTTCMGTDQGKVANLNAFAFLAAERGDPRLVLGLLLGLIGCALSWVFSSRARRA